MAVGVRAVSTDDPNPSPWLVALLFMSMGLICGLVIGKALGREEQQVRVLTWSTPEKVLLQLPLSIPASYEDARPPCVGTANLGALWFNRTKNEIEACDGSGWKEIH